MLVFTRKKNESFVIQVGDEIITVHVNDIGTSPRHAQIGIDAPKDIKVWRSEIYEAMNENKKATKSNISPSMLGKMFKK